MDPAFVVGYLSIGSACLPLAASANRWKFVESEIRGLVIIALASLSCDLATLILSANRINSLLLANGFLLFQFSLLVRIFSAQYSSGKSSMLILYLCIVFVFIVNTAFFQGPWKLNAAFLAASSLMMMVLSLHYFYLLLTKLPTLHIHRLPMLWISFAVLFYYAGNFFQFLISNYILTDNVEAARMLWILHNLLNILKNILFTIAIWQSYRRTSSSLS
jgi:hypothetical protein